MKTSAETISKEEETAEENKIAVSAPEKLTNERSDVLPVRKPGLVLSDLSSKDLPAHLELRPYQKECVDRMNSQTNGRHLIVLATGLGKTVIGSFIRKGQHVLWLSHRDELVEQPRKYFEYAGWTFGIEKGTSHAGDAEIVSASVQTLSRASRLRSFSPDTFDVIVVDEAHHAAAPTYRKILEYFHPKVVFGFTATPRRGDNVRLSDEFDDILYERDIRWGIRNGYLSDIRAYRVSSKMDLNGLPRLMGDYNEAELGRRISDSDAPSIAAQAYLTYCVPQKRHTLIFTVTVHLCQEIQSAILEKLPDSQKDTVAVLTGETPSVVRKAILRMYQEGRILCLINCMVLTEGTDLPVTDAVINLRPTLNPSLYQQMVGRGLRLYPDKKDCLVLDIVNQDEAKAHVLCTAPTLFGIEPRALTGRQKKAMSDTTLAQFADELDEAASTDPEIQIQEIDAFTGDEVERIMSKTGRSEIPKELSDFVIQLGPSEHARYIIRLMDGEIQMSDIDVLGKTELRFYDNEDMVQSLFVPIEDASDAIREWMETNRPEEPPYMWLKEAQAAWARIPATEKQIKTLNDLNDSIFYHALDGKMDDLKKNQAYALLAVGLRAHKQIQAAKAKCRKETENKKAGSFQSDEKTVQDAEKQNAKESIPNVVVKWNARNPRGRAQMHIKDRYMTRHNKKPASQKQRELYCSLISQGTKRRIQYVGAPVSQNLMSCQISPLIDILMHLKFVVPYGKEANVDLDSVLNVINLRLDRGDADEYDVSVPYWYKDPEERQTQKKTKKKSRVSVWACKKGDTS